MRVLAVLINKIRSHANDLGYSRALIHPPEMTFIFEELPELERFSGAAPQNNGARHN